MNDEVYTLRLRRRIENHSVRMGQLRCSRSGTCTVRYRPTARSPRARRSALFPRTRPTRCPFSPRRPFGQLCMYPLLSRSPMPNERVLPALRPYIYIYIRLSVYIYTYIYGERDLLCTFFTRSQFDLTSRTVKCVNESGHSRDYRVGTFFFYLVDWIMCIGGSVTVEVTDNYKSLSFYCFCDLLTLSICQYLINIRSMICEFIVISEFVALIDINYFNVTLYFVCFFCSR